MVWGIKWHVFWRMGQNTDWTGKFKPVFELGRTLLDMDMKLSCLFHILLCAGYVTNSIDQFPFGHNIFIVCFWRNLDLFLALRKKFPYSQFFWSIFSRIWTEYEYFVILRIQSECGKIWTKKTPNMSTFHAV